MFPMCLDVMPFTILMPETWLGSYIPRANVQACTCISVSKLKPRARVVGILSWHLGSEFLKSRLYLVDVNSTLSPDLRYFSHNSWSAKSCWPFISHKSSTFESSRLLPYSPPALLSTSLTMLVTWND